MTRSFCSFTDTKQSLGFTIKTHLSGPPLAKLLERSSDLSNSVEFKRQTASEICNLHPLFRARVFRYSLFHGFYKETEIENRRILFVCDGFRKTCWY